MAEKAKKIKALLLDLEGTLFLKGTQLPGAMQTIAGLREVGVEMRFLTNTDSKTTHTIQQELAQLDLKVPETEIFTAASAARQFLKQHPDSRSFFLLSAELQAAFDVFTKKDGPINFVVVGDCREQVTYETLNQAFQYLMEGAELIALQKGRYFVRANGYNLDTGAFVQMFEYASGKTAQVMGKPTRTFFQMGLDHLGFQAEEVLVVGDDVTTDVAGAKALDARSVLVRTGKFSEQLLKQSSVQPDFIIDSIADLLKLVKELGV